ncbi:MAG: hypothetical protein OXP11_01875 [Gammaproteobacteria bacterium]|nr:hypothetical protein [Gammaproteobacteria bacterium]
MRVSALWFYRALGTTNPPLRGEGRARPTQPPNAREWSHATNQRGGQQPTPHPQTACRFGAFGAPLRQPGNLEASSGRAPATSHKKDEPIEAAFNGVPIVAFINEVFGTQLGMSFVISPGQQEKTDLVTLRPASPVPPF